MKRLRLSKMGTNIINKILLSLFFALAFSGCVSRFFSVGEEKGYCQEHGCDYTDVGLCANPIDILENKSDLSVIKQNNKDVK